MLGANAVEGLMEGSVECPSLMEEISEFCRQHGLAESTFGRLAINDGKLMSRLRTGGRVTDSTRARVHEFMQNGHVRLRRRRHAGHGILDRASYPPRYASVAPSVELEKSFRLYDNRQKYLWFVTTSNEKWVVADRAAAELANIHPRPPAVRLFDAGVGDGSVLARLMRAMHHRFPTMPHYIVGKEISLEDVRLTLEKMPDRFCRASLDRAGDDEPPLRRSAVAGAAIGGERDEHGLARARAHRIHGLRFRARISDLHPFLAANWQARASTRTGNPVYEKPVALVIYRDDYKFLLDSVRPRRGAAKADFDFVLASQPYRARASVEFKARRVIAPLGARAGSRRAAAGHSLATVPWPGLDIIRRIWPEENPFTTDRHQLLRAVKAELGKDARNLTFNASSDARSLFRYEMHTLPNEVGAEYRHLHAAGGLECRRLSSPRSKTTGCPA